MKKKRQVLYPVTAFTEGLLGYPSKFSPWPSTWPTTRPHGTSERALSCSIRVHKLQLGPGSAWARPRTRERTGAQLWGNRDGKRWPESGNMWKLWRKVIEGMNLCKRKMVEKGRHHFRVGQGSQKLYPNLCHPFHWLGSSSTTPAWDWSTPLGFIKVSRIII